MPSSFLCLPPLISLMIVTRCHVLKKLLGLIDGFGHEITSGSHIYGDLPWLLQTIVEGLNQQPIGYPMVWTLPLKLLESLPSLIKRLGFRLVKGCDIILKLGRLPRGKYLQRKALDKAFQVVKELALELRSHDFAFSFKEKEKSLKRIALFETAFIFIVSHFSKKDEICVLGFSK